MKKLIALLLPLLMLVAMLTGCNSNKDGGSQNVSDGGQSQSNSSGSDPQEQITLHYWTHLEEPWNKSDDKMIAAFEQKYPHIKIANEAFPYDEFEAKTMTSLGSSSGGADIYKLWGGWAVNFAPTGAFAPAPADVYAELKQACYPAALGAFELDGKLYGVPLEFNAEWGAMLVNKLYFDENHLSYPTTWDEMINLAKVHSSSSGDLFEMRGFDFISWDTMPYTYLQMILSAGGQYVTDGDHFDFNTPIAIKALQELADYITVDKLASITHLVGDTDIENFDQIFLGRALMAPRGMWTLGIGPEDYGVEPGIDFDYVATPFYGPEKKWAAETGWGLAVNANSANAEAAWLFVEFMTEPDNLRQINIDCGMIPPQKSVAQNFGSFEPMAQPIIDVIDGAQFVGYINTDILKEAIIDAFVDIVQNGTPASEAVLDINSALE